MYNKQFTFTKGKYRTIFYNFTKGSVLFRRAWPFLYGQPSMHIKKQFANEKKSM